MSQTLDTYWKQCCEILHDNLTESAFKTWFQPIQPLSYNDHVLVLQLPSQFCVEYIEENYINILSKTLVRVFGRGIQLEYRVLIDSTSNSGTVIPSESPVWTLLQPEPLPAQMRANTAAAALPEFESQLTPRLNFQEFVQGSSNYLACTAGLNIAQSPGKTAFNPCFIYGGSGVGKTHLANAIGNQIKQLYPHLRVLYVSANTFQMQYQSAVMEKHTNDFYAFYQSIDVLIVDDIQYFADKKGTQNTFFFIFNHLHQMGKQLILTSDKPPLELNGLEQRLLSRFKWGLSVEITKPDFQLRHDILKSKIHRDGLDIDEQIIDYIAENVRDNIRDLEGVIVSLLAHSTLVQTPIDLELTKQVVGRIVEVSAHEINIEQIVNSTCSYYQIDVRELSSRSKRREVANARQVSMYLAKKLTSKSLSDIGHAIGNRNHATVIHAIKTVEETMEYDGVLRKAVQNIKNELLK